MFKFNNSIVPNKVHIGWHFFYQINTCIGTLIRHSRAHTFALDIPLFIKLGVGYDSNQSSLWNMLVLPRPTLIWAHAISRA